MDKASLRRTVYGLLMVVTTGIMSARIVGVEMVHEPSLTARAWPSERPEKQPTFSSNDRSRWATVRALVENETFVVGKRVKDANAREGYRDEGIAFTDGYRSVDYVKDPATDFFYSSKPPLFTVIVAGEYWLLNKGLGWTLADPRFRWPVVCTILIVTNVLPLIIFLILLAALLDEYGETDWGRLFVFTSGCFATFLTTFAVTLNNHTPAACCVMFALYPVLNGRSIEGTRPFTYVELLISGFFAGLAMAFDLPAAAFTAAIALIVLLNRGRGLFIYVFAAIIPLAGLLATNYLAIGDIVPAYDKFGGPWYEYEGSHWAKAKLNPNQGGIDFANEPKEIYAFHMLIGHHGLFSLTPIWLFALLGMLWRSPSMLLRRLNILALLTTGVVIGFYIWKTHNYGGWTSGPRWQFWLTPLFLLAMIRVADMLSKTLQGRVLACAFLLVAVFSAAYPVVNPWRHPWAYQLCEYMGWIRY